MRIATLNLLHSTTSIQDRVEHLIDLLVEENLDFLCLQEVLNPETAGFDIVQRLGEALGLPHSDFIGLPDDNHGVATLSRYPLVREIPEPLVWSKPMLVTRSEVGGRNVYVLNLHASWGSRNGTHRMQEVLYADNLATQFFGRDNTREERPVVVLAGDLNMLPESEGVRYLRGLQTHKERSTTWVDAWEAADEGAEAWTTGDPTYLTQQTSGGRKGGVYDTASAPRRRIDYILVFEWAWGQAGYPMSTRRFASEVFLDSTGRKMAVSDHYGVLTDLFMPDEA